MILHFYNVMSSFTKTGIIINCQLSVQLPIDLSDHEFERTIFAVMLFKESDGPFGYLDITITRLCNIL